MKPKGVESWSQKAGVALLLKGEKRDPTVISFDSIPECDGQTYKWTDMLPMPVFHLAIA